MKIIDMRDFLAARYSKKWVDTKTDEEVLRIYNRILVKAEEEQKKKGATKKNG